MKSSIPFAMTALLLFALAACAEPAAPVPPPAENAAVDLGELPPLVAVPEAQILKAVEIYRVLHDASLDTAQKEERAGALLAASGWTEESYRDLLFDISAHPASRESYVRAIGQP